VVLASRGGGGVPGAPGPSDAQDTDMVWDLRLSFDEGHHHGPLVNELRSLAQTVRQCLTQTLTHLRESAPPTST
jgi:hypothetical protein